MATMTWFMRSFGDSFEAKADFDRYEAAAREVGVGAGGLVLVPYWNGVMSPYWDGSATGTVVGWNLGHGREHLFRAIEEGIAYEYRLAMNGIEAATGVRIREYVILGGGANSDLWCQIMADVLGAAVVRAHTVEATCLGAGILGAYGLGWYPSVEEAAAAMTDVEQRFEPDPRNAEQYDALFTEVYRPLFPALRPQLARLAQLRATS
jgi:xylulokinase